MRVRLRTLRLLRRDRLRLEERLAERNGHAIGVA